MSNNFDLSKQICLSLSNYILLFAENAYIFENNENKKSPNRFVPYLHPENSNGRWSGTILTGNTCVTVLVIGGGAICLSKGIICYTSRLTDLYLFAKQMISHFFHKLVLSALCTFILFTMEFNSVKPLSHQSGDYTAFSQRFKNCRSPSCALCKRQQRHGNAVQSPRTACGGVYFEHAQNKRRGLAFAHSVATMWGLLERRGRVVGAPRERCTDAV